jgi:MYXO-CTERM domain-containing protein
MNNKKLARALTACALVALACGARAEEVMISGWAYGAGNDVLAGTVAARYSGPAGALAGTLGGAAVHDSAPFVTYSLELGEAPGFETVTPAEYELVGGAQYFLSRRGDALIADRLGRLMTYAYDNPDLINSAGGSTALQLAIWNVVYDTDDTVTADPRSSRATAAKFSDASIYQGAANTLLAGARTVLDSKVRIFVLERAATADLLLTRDNPTDTDVPEPGSLLLAASALAAAAAVRRRRIA